MSYRPSIVLTFSTAVIVYILTGVFAPAAAQETGVIAGTVSDASTGERLPGANITLAGRDTLGATTDTYGVFVLAGVPAGKRELRVTFVGYQSGSRSVTVVAGDTTRMSIVLNPRTTVLEGIEVAALSPDLRPEDQMEEVEVREANPRDSGELLRNLPGIEAVRRGPVGLDPVVRGLRESEVGVYLDGSRIFPGGPARMDSPLSHLDPSFVKSINVVKGPYALTWGAGNLSAIRVETQDLTSLQAGSWASTFMGGYDSNMNALESAVSMRGREAGVGYWIHGAWRQGSDYEAGDGSMVPADFFSREIRGKLAIQTGQYSNLTFSAGYQRQDDIDYPGRLLNAEYFDTQNYAGRWHFERPGGNLRSATALAYYNRVQHGMNNDGKPTAVPDESRMPPFPLRVTVDADVDVVGGRLTTQWQPDPQWNLTVGADLYSASKSALRRITNRNNGMVPPPLQPQPDLMWPYTRTTDGGLFTRAERSLPGDITLAGTARLDIVAARADTTSPFFRENVTTKREHNEQNLSGAVTINKALSQFWQVTIGAGSAVRTADATERYSDRIPASKAQTSAEFVGTPGLAPERSSQLDLWVEGRYPNAAVSVNAFARRIDDYITLAPTDLQKRLPLSPPTVYQYVNGAAYFLGSEVSLRYRPVDALTLSLQPVYLWGVDERVDEPALGVTPLAVDTGLRYEPLSGPFFVQGTLHAVTSQNRVAATRGETRTGGYVTADVKGGYRITEGISVQLGITNLTDAAYVNHLNAKNPFTGLQLPEPGRIIYADVQVRL